MAVADRLAEQFAHVVDHRTDIDRLDCQFLAPREGEQLCGELAGSARRRQRTVEQPPTRWVETGLLRNEIERADHRRQEVVEVVRNAACELTERFKFLRLLHPLGQEPTLSDLTHGEQDQNGCEQDRQQGCHAERGEEPPRRTVDMPDRLRDMGRPAGQLRTREAGVAFNPFKGRVAIGSFRLPGSNGRTQADRAEAGKPLAIGDGASNKAAVPIDQCADLILSAALRQQGI